MSTRSGVFQIMVNNGQEDKFLLQVNELNDYINRIALEKIKLERAKNPSVSIDQLKNNPSIWMPTMSEIEKKYIMFTNSTFRPFVAIAHEYCRSVASQGVPELGKTSVFTLPIVGEFINDCVFHIKLSGLSSVDNRDKVRYVEYVGHRLMKQVSIKVSGVTLDTYVSDNYTINYEFKIPNHKVPGYLRCVGHETPKLAYLTADPTADEFRECRYFTNGHQTFKQTQTSLDLWIPLLFWFKDPQCSLPNFLLPKMQTDIEIALEDAGSLVAIANYGGGGAYNKPIIEKCELYANNIYLLPEIFKIFKNRFGFQLIRVHRSQSQVVNTSSQSILLRNLRFPVENIYVGFRPVENKNNSRKWHKNTVITEMISYQPVVTDYSNPLSPIIQVNQAIFYNEELPVADLGIRAFGIDIYPLMNPEFYQSYLPLRYGDRIKTPDQKGWYMFNFSMNPGMYQPSGHFNMSMSRETYLTYTSAVDNNNVPYINPNNPCELLIMADCINFLLTGKDRATVMFAD